MSKFKQLPIEVIIEKLGYSESANLINFDKLSQTIVSKQTLKVLYKLKPFSAYIVDDKPLILFFDNNSCNWTFNEVSKKVWNAQIPIIIYCDAGTVKVYNGTSLDLKTFLLNEIAEVNIEDCSNESTFSYWKITDSLFWQEQYISTPIVKLNEYLLSNIVYLTEKLKYKFNINFATKLVLRLIFIRYLIDRGVDLAYGRFNGDIHESKEELLRVVKNKQELYDLFSYLDEKFNGNLFELGNELESASLTSEVFSLLSDFLAGNLLMREGQTSLFALYDFNIIPVELISNIYEIMLGKESQEKDNAFYTPKYLADFMLNKAIGSFLHENESLCILDPSCGSGVFLVSCYRRIIERNLNSNLYVDDDNFLKNLLIENIYGVDINEEAIDVTIFSLYLTILDYKDPKTLSEFTLPKLRGLNLLVNDFFDNEVLEKLKEVKFDFIIGNPPWGNVRNGLHMNYCKQLGYDIMQQNNEICRSFIFRTKDFCNENTICSFILHSKVLYNKEKPAVLFRSYVLKKMQISNIIEMSAVRKMVFENAVAPAIIITYKYNKDENENLQNKFEYISLKQNIFFKLLNLIVIEKNDIKSINQQLLYNNDWCWKTLVYGLYGDIENILYLKNSFTTLNVELSKQNPEIIKGEGVQYHSGDKKDASHLTGRLLLKSKKGIDHFFVNRSNIEIFTKKNIHRPKDFRLFEPPYCINSRGINVKNYKMKAAFSEDNFVCRHTMYIFKGNLSQKDFLLNLTGLLNSSFYAYLNLMLGSSIAIEREQRSMGEVLQFPYIYNFEIVKKVIKLHKIKEKNSIAVFSNIDEFPIIEDIDSTILKSFGLHNNFFVEYALNIQIPELVNDKRINVNRDVTTKELELYSSFFLDEFSTIFNRTNKYITINLYKNIMNKFVVFELIICDIKPENVINVIFEESSDIRFLAKFSIYNFNDKFHQIRDVINFKENSFFILKSKAYKNWHPAIAKIDISEVMDQIMESTGGGEV